VSNPRVQVEHSRAVVSILGEGVLATMAPVLGASSGDALAHDIAAAVLGAYDDTTRYVVLVREPDDAGLTVFGPYATAAAAEKALHEGHAFALRQQGALARIYPLTPSPKAAKGKKNKGANA